MRAHRFFISLLLALILTSPSITLPLHGTIKLLVIDDEESPWDVKSMEVLSRLNPSIEFKAIAWRRLKSEPLTHYHWLVIGSGYSSETLDGICFFMSRVLKYVREAGLNLLILNNVIRFGEGEPQDWWDVEVLKSLTIHYDKPPILTFQKLCNKIDPSLKVVKVDENEEFNGYVIRQLVLPRAHAPEGITPSVLKLINGSFLAFGWFEAFDHDAWKVALYGKIDGGALVPVAIYTRLGKGCVFLTTLFLDRLIVKEPRCKSFYDAIFYLGGGR